MSCHWIVLIPENPRLCPDRARQKNAEMRFAEIAPNAADIVCTSTDKVIFFDCGQNLERVSCPSCASELTMEWWVDRMDEDFEDGGFRLGRFKVPCCNFECSLHDLVYDGPQGYGRFSIEAMEPLMVELDERHKAELEEILGTPLRVIYRHG